MVGIFLFLLQLSLSSFADSTNSCQEIFVVKYGEVNPNFPHNTQYTVELPHQSAVKNQCSTSHCHLYAWTAELENTANIDISSEYLDLMRIYYKAMTALEKGEVTFSGDMGAFSLESRTLIKQVGVIPQEAWNGSKDFIKEPMYSRLMKALEAIVARTTTQVQEIKGKNKQEQINAVIAQGQKSIHELLSNVVGTVPTEFDYKGKTYTPQSFAKEFFPELYLPLTVVEVDAEHTKVVRLERKDHIRMKMTPEAAETTMREIIDSGLPVYLTYHHDRQFVDSKTGIMSLEAIEYPAWAKALSQNMLEEFDKWPGGHAVLVVGYDVDPQTNRVIKWKIRNSWSDKMGDHGYYHMYADYFELYAYGFSFVQEGLTLSQMPGFETNSSNVIAFPIP